MSNASGWASGGATGQRAVGCFKGRHRLRTLRPVPGIVTVRILDVGDIFRIKEGQISSFFMHRVGTGADTWLPTVGLPRRLAEPDVMAEEKDFPAPKVGRAQNQ